MKKCPKCKKAKSFSEFGIDNNRNDKLNCYCKPCVRLNSRKTAKNRKRIYNPETTRIRRLKRTPEQKSRDNIAKRDSMLRIRYGISLEKYDKMLVSQEGKCFICERHAKQFRNALAVDHNHKTGEIRGLLCQSCNRVLGLLKVDSDLALVNRMLFYITKD